MAMTTLAIEDFVYVWSELDKSNKRVQNTTPPYETWMTRFTQAGYIQISCDFKPIEKMGLIEWCIEQFGKSHFQIIGTNVFFETEEDATLFALRWL